LAEKLNNVNKSYRVAGIDALKDFQNTGVLRSVQQGVSEGASLIERAMSRPTAFPSFQKGYANMRYAPEEGAVVFETGLPTFKRGEINPVTGFPIKGRHYAHRVIDLETGAALREIPAFDIRVFGDKPHWFKGYQEVPIQLPGSPNAFKSEINWNNWNKEIPENTQLMKEYNTIEQQAKANGTWMKNADGSKFTGTPEQFIQQNSNNFKKAFPEGSEKTYRGDRAHYNIMNEKDYNSATFSGDKQIALNYTYDNAKQFTSNSPLGVNPNYGQGVKSSDGMYELYGRNSKNSIKIDAQNRDYTRLKLDDLAGDDYVSTNDIASYIKSKNIDNATISNVYDSSFKPGTVRINNNKIGNYLKSMRGNNGMFDMTNPNIYKSVLPIGLGLGATQYKQGGATNNYVELDLTPEEIKDLIAQGYVIEEHN